MFETLMIFAVIVLGLYGISNRFNGIGHLVRSIFQIHNILAVIIIAILLNLAMPYIFTSTGGLIFTAVVFYGMIKMILFAFDGLLV